MKKRRIYTLAVVVLFGIMVFSLASQAQETAPAKQPPGFFDFWQLPKIWVAAGLVLVGTVLLMLKRLSRALRLVLMALAFVAFGVLSELPLGNFARGMGLHPSPMCVIEKPFLFLHAGRAIPIVFISIFTFIAVLTILSNKGFCSWACPIGAIQELLYRIPIFKKLKRKLPFKTTNLIRTAIFVLFLILTFSIGFTIYGWINAFHILHWSWDVKLVIPIFVAIVGAFFIYRPFCYLICPLGLFTWVLEHISLVRVKLDKKSCTDCMLCVTKSPCPTVPAILEMKKSRPDCHGCGDCITACPENALRFKM